VTWVKCRPRDSTAERLAGIRPVSDSTTTGTNRNPFQMSRWSGCCAPRREPDAARRSERGPHRLGTGVGLLVRQGGDAAFAVLDSGTKSESAPTSVSPRRPRTAAFRRGPGRPTGRTRARASPGEPCEPGGMSSHPSAMPSRSASKTLPSALLSLSSSPSSELGCIRAIGYACQRAAPPCD
jgi:hypothetical protein